ncbi:MAG: META domain-containing protein [Coriobacteriia bacterium]
MGKGAIVAVSVGAVVLLAVGVLLVTPQGQALLGLGTHRLDGTSWRLAEWAATELDPGDFTITASFEQGRISGRSGVNSYSGPYRAASGGSFSASNLAMTEMAGPEPAMKAESLYIGLLIESTNYRLDGARLVLSDANGRTTLVFERAAE